jgi:hypothetical protein
MALDYEPAFCKFITKDPIRGEAKPLLACFQMGERAT